MAPIPRKIVLQPAQPKQNQTSGPPFAVQALRERPLISQRKRREKGGGYKGGGPATVPHATAA
eukprot:2544338-Rhodomonas_salina.1